MEKTEYFVIVAGGRHFNAYNILCEKLDAILSTKVDTHRIVIVSGAASGADTLGERYADERGYGKLVMPAKWNRQPNGSYDASAGYKRNVAMGDVAHACVTFWDGKSTGTKHMIDIATRKGIPLRVIRYE